MPKPHEADGPHGGRNPHRGRNPQGGVRPHRLLWAHMGRLADWLHRSYLFGLGMQALIGGTQLLAALVLLSAHQTNQMAGLSRWTGHLLASQTPDPIALSLLHTVHDFSAHPHGFWSVYLLGHGILNLGVVLALLRGKAWAHPASILVLTAFIVYQMDRFALTHAPVLVVLSVFDLAVILLVGREWWALRARRAAERAGETAPRQSASRAVDGDLGQGGQR